MIVTFTRTQTLTVTIDEADLVKLMDEHGLSVVEGQSTADRLYDTWNDASRFAVDLLQEAEIADEATDIEEVFDDENDEEAPNRVAFTAWR